MEALRLAVLNATNPTSDARIATLLSTWNPASEACGADTCRACTLTDNSTGHACGAAASTGSPAICKWMYVACTGGSVTSINLGEPRSLAASWLKPAL